MRTTTQVTRPLLRRAGVDEALPRVQLVGETGEVPVLRAPRDLRKAEREVAERAADGDVGERHVDAGAPGLVGHAGADRAERGPDLHELAVDPGLAALAVLAAGP